MQVQLRDYQADAFDQAREAIRGGARRILIVAPTGSGKTVLASALMEMCREKGNRANFVVDRLSLIGQTSDTFDRYGLSHGVVQGGHHRWAPYHPLQLCSVQTLAKRGWPDASVDVFDEAHVLHTTHKNRLKEGASIVVGLTATPFTKGLGQWFDAVVNVTTTRQLIRDGWLADYRIFACVEPDMADVTVKKTGEWDEKEASGKALKIVGDVVDEYLKHGEGRKFICSAVDTAHVEALAEQFRAAGVTVATYTYRDREEDRADTVAEFRKLDSTIRGLITVTAASRGFDVPDVSCVIMARPLRKSLAEHIQLFGRGLRMAEGKADCLVLDHSGNCARFFEECERFFDEGADTLCDGVAKKDRKRPEKKADAEPRKCPQCRALHKPMPACPACGHVYPRAVTVEHVPGTLKELIRNGTPRQLSAALWPQIVGYAVRRWDAETAKRKAKGYYKGITGQWPASDWAEPVEPSPEVVARIRSQQIRYANRRAA